jgi:hypothetical protein
VLIDCWEYCGAHWELRSMPNHNLVRYEFP